MNSMNPEFHDCECGHRWRHGQSGAHDCGPYYRQTIRHLRDAVVAAAPQVVADEREFVEAIASNFDSHDRETDEIICRGCSAPELWDETTQGYSINHRPECIVNRARAALASAPVQAQEPVPEAAQQNGGLVRAALIDLMALEDKASYSCHSFEEERDCNLRFARARKALADSTDTAPVQPVAVHVCSFGADPSGKKDSTAAVQAAIDSFATPAAQGDAKDSIIRFGASLVGHASTTDAMDEDEVISWVKSQYDEWSSALTAPSAGTGD